MVHVSFCHRCRQLQNGFKLDREARRLLSAPGGKPEMTMMAPWPIRCGITLESLRCLQNGLWYRSFIKTKRNHFFVRKHNNIHKQQPLTFGNGHGRLVPPFEPLSNWQVVTNSSGTKLGSQKRRNQIGPPNSRFHPHIPRFRHTVSRFCPLLCSLVCGYWPVTNIVGNQIYR